MSPGHQPSSGFSDVGFGSDVSYSDDSMDEYCDDEEIDNQFQAFYPPLQVDVDERGKPVHLSFAHHNDNSDDDELFVPRSLSSSSVLCHSRCTSPLPQQQHQTFSPPIMWSGKMPLDLFHLSSSSDDEDEEEIKRKYGSVTHYYYLKGVEFTKKANAIQRQRAATELKVKLLAQKTQLMSFGDLQQATTSVSEREIGRQQMLDYITKDTLRPPGRPLVFDLVPDCESPSSVSSVSSEECNPGEEEAMKALKTANKILTKKAHRYQTKTELAKARTMIKNVELNHVMLEGQRQGS